MSTKGIDDGYIGDENDVVYGPRAPACCEKNECKVVLGRIIIPSRNKFLPQIKCKAKNFNAN